MCGQGFCTREALGGRAELATQGGMTRGSEQTDPKPENADKRIQSETESDRLLATDRIILRRNFQVKFLRFAIVNLGHFLFLLFLY